MATSRSAIATKTAASDGNPFVWFIALDDGEGGPLSEQEVIDILKTSQRGRDDMLIKRDGETVWRSASTHARFAIAIQKRERATEDSPGRKLLILRNSSLPAILPPVESWEYECGCGRPMLTEDSVCPVCDALESDPFAADTSAGSPPRREPPRMPAPETVSSSLAPRSESRRTRSPQSTSPDEWEFECDCGRAMPSEDALCPVCDVPRGPPAKHVEVRMPQFYASTRPARKSPSTAAMLNLFLPCIGYIYLGYAIGWILMILDLMALCGVLVLVGGAAVLIDDANAVRGLANALSWSLAIWRVAVTIHAYLLGEELNKERGY